MVSYGNQFFARPLVRGVVVLQGLRSIEVDQVLINEPLRPWTQLNRDCFVFGAGRAGFACVVALPLVGDALDAGTAAPAGFLGAAGVLLLLVLVLGAFLGAAFLVAA